MTKQQDVVNLASPCPVNGWYDHDWLLKVIEKKNGTRQIFLRCSHCGALGPVSYKDLRSYGVDPYELPVDVSYVTIDQVCCVDGCWQTRTELHHFAPRGVFGTEADDWPVLPLCVNHHTTWHLAMNGYKWEPVTKEKP
jgi:hypothetical protein